VFGYNFSLAGVAGRVRGPFARGGAESVGMDGQEDTPMPKGMAWNMVVDSHAPPGNVPSATMEELWQRLEYFLEEILPVAEESGVTPLIQMILPVNRYVVSLDLFTNLICIKSFSI
jgi:mannonate dehydratase